MRERVHLSFLNALACAASLYCEGTSRSLATPVTARSKTKAQRASGARWALVVFRPVVIYRNWTWPVSSS